MDLNGRKLSTYVERVERLNEEAKGTSEAIKEVLAEAKGEGFEPKYIRRLVKERGQDQDKLKMEEAEYQAYRDAVGLG